MSGLTAESLNAFRIESTKPERIVFVVDVCEEMQTEFSDRTRIEIVKETLKMIIWRKCSSQLKHEYAVLTYRSDCDTSIQVVVPFTKSYDLITDSINSISVLSIFDTNTSSSFNNTERNFDISELFENEKLHGILQDKALESSSIRFIFIYGNSFNIPQISRPIQIFNLPHVHCDVLYLHHKQNIAGVQFKHVFEVLSQLESQQGCKNVYVFEVSTNASMRLLAIGCALMAHPLLRDQASEFMTKLDVSQEQIDLIKSIDHSHKS